MKIAPLLLPLLLREEPNGMLSTRVCFGAQCHQLILETNDYKTIVPCIGCETCEGSKLHVPQTNSTGEFDYWYSDGSNLRGNLYRNTICLGPTCFRRIDYGCASYYPPPWRGINGELGMRILGTPYRLWNNTLTFGRGSNEYLWMPDFPSFQIGDLDMKSTLPVRVSSGTSYTYIPQRIHTRLKKWFCREGCDFTGAAPIDARDSPGCWRTPPIIQPLRIGPMSFHPRNYVFWSSQTTFCVGIFPGTKFILGANAIKGNDWLFDGMRIGIRAVS